MSRIGIVGHEESKFTPEGKRAAVRVIEELLTHCDVLVSGGCHLGGVDIWAEQVADYVGATKVIHLPKRRTWSGGYKERNELIARDSDEVHVIVVDALPATYTGMRFPLCYHCKTDAHVKSGGCWTGKVAQRLGKPAVWHTISQLGVSQGASTP